MTVDVRARSFCNLGTIIQASIADEALSARQGLIRCRGQVVIDGLITPEVGSFVYFGWERDGTIARVPRTLRVLSSFANPFTRQTTVQLGDKLTYLANLKGKRVDPNEQDPQPETPDNPAPPEPVEPPTNPDQEGYPFSEYEYDEENQCYILREGVIPFLFDTQDAANIIRAIEQFLDAPASILGQVPLTIPAEVVLAKCLTALGISKTGTELIAQFTVDRFDLSSGYVNVIDQLLANESLYGYLNESEVLVIGKVEEPSGDGPLLDTSTIIQLEGINQGLLPGQEITVSLETRPFNPEPPPEPEPTPEPEPEPEPQPEEEVPEFAEDTTFPEPGSPEERQALNNWELQSDTVYGESAEFYLEDGTTYEFAWNTTTVTKTNYDDDNYVTSRVTLVTTGAANFLASIIQAKLQAAYDAAGGNPFGAFNPPNDVLNLANGTIIQGSREDYFYEIVRKEPQPIPDRSKLCSVQQQEGQQEPTVADEAANEEVEKVLVRQVNSTYSDARALLGQLNLGGIDWAEYQGGIPGGIVLTEQVVIEYDSNQPSGQTKTVTKRFRAYGNLQQGQSDASIKGLATVDEAALQRLLSIAADLRLETTTISVQRDRTFGVQRRPTIEQLTNDAAEITPPTGAEADEETNTVDVELVQESGTTETQPTLDTSLPFGSDDGFVWNASDGFQFRGSNAGALALRYARSQNAILRGNRSGLSLQIPAYAMPLYPLSYVYIQAANATGAYRSNGMSWAINSDGILCSMDALFWGGVGGTGTAWFPVAPGITALPADPSVTFGTPAPGNSTTTPTGFDPTAPTGIWSILPVGQDPVYEQSIAPTALVPVVNERIRLAASIKTMISVRERNYSLTLPTASAALVTKSVVQVVTRLFADEATLTTTGQAAALKLTKRVKAGAGSFVTAGFGAGSIRDYRIGTNAGTFVLSGQVSTARYQRKPLLAEAGAFTFSGQNAAFKKAIIRSSLAGAFSLTGADAGSRRGYVLKGEAAETVLSGGEAGLFISDYFGKWASQTYGYEALVYPDWWAD